MGSSETDESAKEPKAPLPARAQDQAPPMSTAAVNAEQSGFQAYSPIPPHGFLASHPQAHPYMWGVQHMVPSYGAPPHPYMAMYPHGGLYAHPSIPPGAYHFSPFAVPHQNGMTEASGNTIGNADADGKPPEGKEKLPIKRSKGSLGSLKMITGKSDEECKTTGPSATPSKSAESASDGSSEGSDASSRRNSPTKSGGRQEESEADVPQNGSSAHVTQNGVPHAPHAMVSHALPFMAIPAPGAPAPVPGPTTNLNIGMDYWGTPASSAVPAVQGKVPSAPLAAGLVPAGSQDNLQSPLWLQDEKELKRQRRKQSNRESARRSRLRKQAEYDELAQRAELLKDENANLRSELNRIRSEYEQLMAEHAALKKRIGEVPRDLTASRTEQGVVTDTQGS